MHHAMTITHTVVGSYRRDCIRICSFAICSTHRSEIDHTFGSLISTWIISWRCAEKKCESNDDDGWTRHQGDDEFRLKWNEENARREAMRIHSSTSLISCSRLFAQLLRAVVSLRRTVLYCYPLLLFRSSHLVGLCCLPKNDRQR